MRNHVTPSETPSRSGEVARERKAAREETRTRRESREVSSEPKRAAAIRPMRTSVVRSGAMQMNPVLWREWRGRWRRPLTPIAVTFYAALLALATWYAYPEQQGLETQQATAATMQTLLKTLSCWQITMASVLAATMAASSIVAEKELGLWMMLRLSPLSASEIVRGKMMASCAFIALLLFAPLPMNVTLLLIGGVPISECVLVLLLQLVTAMLCGALALTISTISRSVAAALGASLPLAAAVLLVPIATLLALGSKDFPAYAFLCILVGSFVTWGLVFHIAPSLIENEILGNDWGTPSHTSDVLSPRYSETPRQVPLPLTKSSVSAHSAMARIEETSGHAATNPVFARETIGATAGRAQARTESKAPERQQTMAEIDALRLRDPQGSVRVEKEWAAALARAHNVDGPIGEWLRFDNPVLQRAARHHFASWCRLSAQELVAVKFVVGIFWTMAMAILAATYYSQKSAASDYYAGSGRNNSDAPLYWLGAGLLWIAFSTIKVAALSFAADRAQGMLKPLLMTRLTPRDIVWGKLGAALLAGLAPALLFLPIVGFALGVAPLATLAALLVMASCVWLCACCGLMCSWCCESTPIAICGTLAMLFGGGLLALYQIFDDSSLVGKYLRRCEHWPEFEWWLYPQTPWGWLHLGATAAILLFALGLLALIPVVRALRPAALEKDKPSLLNTDLSKAF